eukprot:3246819-Rhodomonas_salina.2
MARWSACAEYCPIILCPMSGTDRRLRPNDIRLRPMSGTDTSRAVLPWRDRAHAPGTVLPWHTCPMSGTDPMSHVRYWHTSRAVSGTDMARWSACAGYCPTRL